MSSLAVNVVHNIALSRFEAMVDGLLCVADYDLNGSVMHMTHTAVPRELEGRGIAAALVASAFEWARAKGYKINPACSYVRVYMQRHTETQNLRA